MFVLGCWVVTWFPGPVIGSNKNNPTRWSDCSSGSYLPAPESWGAANHQHPLPGVAAESGAEMLSSYPMEEDWL